MEAASIPWRPLGRLLVEQGLLTDKELELALAKQQITGKRLGETIVECGFVSRPDLSNALAAQYGIELKTETGFGTGLRAQIQQRHESDRGRVVTLRAAEPREPSVELSPDLVDIEPPPPPEAALLAQLEEQWAKLAAAEERLAERELALAALVVERDGRQAQAERLARHARRSRAEQAVLEGRNEELTRLGEAVDARVEEQRAVLAAAEERLGEQERAFAALTADRDRRRAQVVRFIQKVRRRDDELERRNDQLASLGEAVDGRLEEQRVALAAAEERLTEQERTFTALIADRDRRRAQAVRFAQRARTRDEELSRRSEVLLGLREATEGLRDQVERLSSDVRGCDAEIERLRHENTRRRAQAARFAARLRDRRGQDVELVATSTVIERDERRAQAERLARLARLSRAEQAAERERRRAQVLRFVERVRSRDDELERRDEELSRLGAAADGQIDAQRAMLAAAEHRLAEREHELAALAADRDRRRAQVARFARRVRTRDDELHRLRNAAERLLERVAQLSNDVRGCDAEIARLRHENTRRRAQAARFAARIRELPGGAETDPVVTPSSHLVFVQLAGGYELVERDGPPPPRNAPLELPDLCDGALVVSGLRRSPLPGDARPCVVAQRA